MILGLIINPTYTTVAWYIYINIYIYFLLRTQKNISALPSLSNPKKVPSLPKSNSVSMERSREGKLKSKGWVKEEEEEDDGGGGDGEVAIGLCLGDEKKKRSGGGGSMKGCQANKCGDDLRDAKPYHRRHKVCEHHAKAFAVLVAGILQRFCQQCSRFITIGLLLYSYTLSVHIIFTYLFASYYIVCIFIHFKTI